MLGQRLGHCGLVRAVCAVCLLVWRVAMSEHCVATSYIWGDPTLLCPVATDDSVIVAYGEDSSDAIATYDGKTGLLLWQKYCSDTSFVGAMKVCDYLLYAPTLLDEVYVLDVRDGRLIQHLKTGRHSERVKPVIACTPGYVFITDPKNREDAVVAIDTADFEVVWRHIFPWPFLICEITSSGPTVEILLGEFDDNAWLRAVVLGSAGGTGTNGEEYTVARAVPP